MAGAEFWIRASFPKIASGFLSLWCLVFFSVAVVLFSCFEAELDAVFALT